MPPRLAAWPRTGRQTATFLARGAVTPSSCHSNRVRHGRRNEVHWKSAAEALLGLVDKALHLVEVVREHGPDIEFSPFDCHRSLAHKAR